MTAHETPAFTHPSTREAGLDAERRALLDDLVGPEAADAGSSNELGDLRDELVAELDEETKPLEVSTRAGFAVVFSKDIDFDLLKAYRRRAGGTKTKDADELRFSSIILASACRRILRNGEPLTAEGEPVTFASPAFLELYGVGRAVEAVRRFYGRDGVVLAAANWLLAEAGYGDEPLEEDPTRGSSPV